MTRPSRTRRTEVIATRIATAIAAEEASAASSGDVATHAALTTGVHGITAFGASLVNDADAAAGRTTLGLGTAATAASGDFAAASHTHPASAVTDFSEAVDDRVAALLVAGSNVTLIYDDGAGTLTVAATGGGGSAAWTETEVDFGSTPVYDATFTIVDAGVSATTEVAVVQSGKAATGRAAGDAAWDSIAYAADPGTGQFTLYALASPGPVTGPRKLLYQVGT